MTSLLELPSQVTYFWYGVGTKAGTLYLLSQKRHVRAVFATVDTAYQLLYPFCTKNSQVKRVGRYPYEQLGAVRTAVPWVGGYSSTHLSLIHI